MLVTRKETNKGAITHLQCVIWVKGRNWVKWPYHSSRLQSTRSQAFLLTAKAKPRIQPSNFCVTKCTQKKKRKKKIHQRYLNCSDSAKKQKINLINCCKSKASRLRIISSIEFLSSNIERFYFGLGGPSVVDFSGSEPAVPETKAHMWPSNNKIYAKLPHWSKNIGQTVFISRDFLFFFPIALVLCLGCPVL